MLIKVFILHGSGYYNWEVFDSDCVYMVHDMFVLWLTGTILVCYVTLRGDYSYSSNLSLHLQIVIINALTGINFYFLVIMRRWTHKQNVKGSCHYLILLVLWLYCGVPLQPAQQIGWKHNTLCCWNLNSFWVGN